MLQSEIPEKWRAQALSAVRHSDYEQDPVSSCYFREQDYCYIEDDANDGEFFMLVEILC